MINAFDSKQLDCLLRNELPIPFMQVYTLCKTDHMKKSHQHQHAHILSYHFRIACSRLGRNQIAVVLRYTHKMENSKVTEVCVHLFDAIFGRNKKIECFTGNCSCRWMSAHKLFNILRNIHNR